jgi:hypothetical protein
MLTLFRPATGELRAKGVVSASNAILHPWLKAQLTEILDTLEKKQPAASLPPEEERPLCAQWKTWIWSYESAEGLPPLRILAGLGITWLATSPSIWCVGSSIMA